MNIALFIVSYQPLVGGAEVAAQNIIKYSKHSYIVITAKQRKESKRHEETSNSQIYRIGFGLPLDKHLFVFFAPIFYLYLTLVKKVSIDLLWSMMANQAGYATLLLSIVTPKKYLLSIQEGDSEEWFKNKERLPLYSYIYTKSAHIQAISKFLRDRSLKYGNSSITVVPNGYDESVFVRGNVTNHLEYRIITASRLVEKNGVDLLIHAFSMAGIKNSKLIIAGTGSLEAELRLIAKNYKDANIEFVGNLDHQKLSLLMQECDVFARLSRSEGLGNVFIESGALGLPSIATNVGGIPDVVKHDYNGVLVEPNDIKQAALAITRLHDKDLRLLMSNNAILFTKAFSWKSVSVQIDEILDDYIC